MKQKVPYIAVVFTFGLWYMAAAQMHCKPKDCYDLSCYRQSKGKDGPHIIYPGRPALPSLEVACDQETDHGGWIMYQRRVDGTLNFTKKWKDYKEGFGDNGGNTTELWLGNEHVFQLLQSYGGRGGKLRIEADAFDSDSTWIEANNFTMSDEASLYSINWETSVASAGRITRLRWNEIKTHTFKTIDKPGGEKQCLDRLNGGWWYHTRCANIFLNGEYVNSSVPTVTGIFVQGFKQSFALKRTRMMFRPTNDAHTCNNPCKNGGTCDYDDTTKKSKCRCSVGFYAPTCEPAGTAPPITQPETPTPTSPTTSIMPLVGGILLLLILICLCITAGVIYKRRQRKKREDAKPTGLALATHLDVDSFQEYMLSMFGF